MNHPVLVYSHSASPRLQYIVDFLSQYYGHSFQLVYDEERFIHASERCKINYGYKRLAAGEIFIHSHALLFVTSIRPVQMECIEQNGYKAFFKTQDDFGFDLFAAVFYLITRYEEYLPHQKDRYGRYAHENSVAFKENFLHLPLVNIWLEDFRKWLAEKNPEFRIPNSEFSFLPTYDIDMAWSYRNKGIRRNSGGIVLLFLKLKFRKAIHRIRVIRKKIQDPFDAYEWMDRLHEQYRIAPVYFFLVAGRKGKYDKNIDTGNAEFQQLIRNAASKYSIGLHPSWASGNAPLLLMKEKDFLEKITGQTIYASRQHYIRFALPSTYRKLLTHGITSDYSMGYGSINGFRASIATSFYWYDLEKEEKTELLLHPFCFMDANAYYEQKFSPDAALQELMYYYEVIKSINGTMITIWHNSFLGTDEEFAGWKMIYEKFISSIKAT